MQLPLLTLSVAALGLIPIFTSSLPNAPSSDLALERRQSEKLGLFDMGTVLDIIADFAYIQAYGLPATLSDTAVKSSDYDDTAYADIEASGSEDAECNADPEFCLDMTNLVADVAVDVGESMNSIF